TRFAKPRELVGRRPIHVDDGSRDHALDLDRAHERAEAALERLRLYADRQSRAARKLVDETLVSARAEHEPNGRRLATESSLVSRVSGNRLRHVLDSDPGGDAGPIEEHAALVDEGPHHGARRSIAFEPVDERHRE